MSIGAAPKAQPAPAAAAPPPPAATPQAPIVGEGSAGRRKAEAGRNGTRSLRTDLMIVPGAAGIDGSGLNAGR